MRSLREQLSYDQASIVTEAKDDGNGGKSLYMEGIFVQGDKRNQNQRVYPTSEIAKAVKSVQSKIDDGFTVLGEADHPDDLQVNLDRVSHMIEKMWMQGSDGYGRLKILPTPMGNICKTLLENFWPVLHSKEICCYFHTSFAPLLALAYIFCQDCMLFWKVSLFP